MALEGCHCGHLNIAGEHCLYLWITIKIVRAWIFFLIKNISEVFLLKKNIRAFWEETFYGLKIDCQVSEAFFLVLVFNSGWSISDRMLQPSNWTSLEHPF